MGLKFIKDVLLHLHASDRFKILLNYIKHISIQFKHKNEKRYFRYLKGVKSP